MCVTSDILCESLTTIHFTLNILHNMQFIYTAAISGTLNGRTSFTVCVVEITEKTMEILKF